MQTLAWGRPCPGSALGWSQTRHWRGRAAAGLLSPRHAGETLQALETGQGRTIRWTCTGPTEARELEHLGCLGSPAGQGVTSGREDRVHNRGQKSLVLGVFKLRVDTPSGSHGDVALNLLPGPLHILWGASHLKARLLVTGRGHDVSIGDLLDSLHRGPLGADHQPYHAVGDSHKYRNFVLFQRRRKVVR